METIITTLVFIGIGSMFIGTSCLDANNNEFGYIALFVGLFIVLCAVIAQHSITR